MEALYGITHQSVVSQHSSNHPGVWLRLLAVAKIWQGSAGKQSFMVLTRQQLQSQASTAAVLVAVPKLAMTSAATLPSSWQPFQMARPGMDKKASFLALSIPPLPLGVLGVKKMNRDTNMEFGSCPSQRVPELSSAHPRQCLDLVYLVVLRAAK